MNRRARSALKGLFASRLPIAMTTAAANAEAAAGPGSLDTSFDASGKVLTSLARVSQEGNQTLPRDAAVAGAHFRGTSVFGVARLDSGGSLVSGSATAGVLITNFQDGDIAEAVVQPDGDIVATGFSEGNTTGAVDVALAATSSRDGSARRRTFRKGYLCCALSTKGRRSW